MTTTPQSSAAPSKHYYQRPELLAPAGNWDCAKAAIENGADAIYFGLEQFNARMRAENFTQADLPRLMAYLHKRGVKGYVTLNTLVFTHEFAAAEQYLRTMIAAGVDAVIVQDVGLCRLIRHLSVDFPMHASTQMTVTSAAGVAFAQALGCQLVVLARECSLKQIHKIQQQLKTQALEVPLEVFVHGALCVAYSGQCLTSEALGGRSANRGECAQACRMPYELVADGETVDLGDRRYLLSPQDLSGLAVLPELVQTGVTCLKIEGRLKTPEYVANVTRVYRQALDRVLQSAADRYTVLPSDRYALEMSFSRGLDSGWFEGNRNQTLVHGRFGKKRGVYLGEVKRVSQTGVEVELTAAVKPGDGVVFDGGHPEASEQGGRVYSVATQASRTRLTFGRRDLDLSQIRVGDKLWKTSDPELEKQVRQTYSGDRPHFQQPLLLEVYGQVDQPLTLVGRDRQGHVVQIESDRLLVEAHKRPLTTQTLEQQLGRLGNTPFYLAQLTNHLIGALMLPVSELNQLRRDLVAQLVQLRQQPLKWHLQSATTYQTLLPPLSAPEVASSPQLIVLVRNLPQLQAALSTGVTTLYCEFEDPRKYQQAIEWVNQQRSAAQTDTTALPLSLWLAPPRITKPSEVYILEQVKRAKADGYLVRNYDQLSYFAGERCIGDFSLNVANPLTADYFKQLGLERLTASYDLNIQQLSDLLSQTPPYWLEVTIHQHMPLFHMEHCVFCAFLSTGQDFRDCGRPCEAHQVKVRDRVGTEHILQADAGCRNTVYNGVAQTGSEYVHRLLNLGLRHFRLEFLQETPTQVKQIITSYQQLLQGQISGTRLWQTLKLSSQLGVTRGPLEAPSE
ncbi:U32 family peptidase [Almyronema epifaneia]|uniref:DUF3656 domain-containing protein n=1 Tax=Almyronema epifaneia S1 TaxID=2991925 RepID=A0ABW6IDR7_9CYAN